MTITLTRPQLQKRAEEVTRCILGCSYKQGLRVLEQGYLGGTSAGAVLSLLRDILATPEPQAFAPPPHANAEVHKRIMKKLRKMSAEEILGKEASPQEIRRRRARAKKRLTPDADGKVTYQTSPESGPKRKKARASGNPGQKAKEKNKGKTERKSKTSKAEPESKRKTMSEALRELQEQEKRNPLEGVATLRQRSSGSGTLRR